MYFVNDSDRFLNKFRINSMSVIRLYACLWPAVKMASSTGPQSWRQIKEVTQTMT